MGRAVKKMAKRKDTMDFSGIIALSFGKSKIECV